MELPQDVCGWIRVNSTKTVTAESIFDYMNGAGELYLGYRFDRLEVSNYRKSGQEDIMVELYFMKSSDDAFGLLSLDWSGEPVNLLKTDSLQSASKNNPPIRALYAAGLLRLWSGNLYGRILAYRETPESHDAVIAIGKACIQEEKSSDIPEWVHSLPVSLNNNWILEKDQIRFLRTHLVFNSVYFLSFSNILKLDLSTEITAGCYRSVQENNNRPGLIVFIIRYESSVKASEALAEFHQAYYPELPRKPKENPADRSIVRFTEDRWSGYIQNGSCAVLCFEFPERTILENVLMELVSSIKIQ